MSEPLHLKYRPKTFEEVIGQETVIKSLKTMLASETVPHTFLLTGNSGTGKTTLARIIASHFDYDVMEVDVASQNSAESARELVERLDQSSPVLLFLDISRILESTLERGIPHN